MTSKAFRYGYERSKLLSLRQFSFHLSYQPQLFNFTYICSHK